MSTNKIIELLENINLEPFEPTEEDFSAIPWPEYSALTYMDEYFEDIELELTKTFNPQ